MGKFGFRSKSDRRAPPATAKEPNNAAASVEVVRPSGMQLTAAFHTAIKTFRANAKPSGQGEAKSRMPSFGQIRRMVESRHPEWKISHRRGKKYMSRSFRRNGIKPSRDIGPDGVPSAIDEFSENSDDDISTMSNASSVMTSPRAVLRKVFRRGRKAKSDSSIASGLSIESHGSVMYGPENRPRSERDTSEETEMSLNTTPRASIGTVMESSQEFFAGDADEAAASEGGKEKKEATRPKKPKPAASAGAVSTSKKVSAKPKKTPKVARSALEQRKSLAAETVASIASFVTDESAMSRRESKDRAAVIVEDADGADGSNKEECFTNPCAIM